MLEHDLDLLQRTGRADQVSFYPLMTRTHRAAQDGKEHGARTTRRCAIRCTSGSSPACWATNTTPRPRGASRATRACSTSTSSTRTTTSVSAAARSVTSAARMYSTTFSLNHYCRRVEGRAERHHAAPVAVTRSRKGCATTTWYGSSAANCSRDYIERRYGKCVLVADGARVARDAGDRRDAPRCRRDPAHPPRHVLLGADDGRVLQLGEFRARTDARAHPRRARYAWNEDAKVPAVGDRPHARAARPQDD